MKNITKLDYIYISIIFFLFSTLTAICWGNWGDVFIDLTREIYLPTLVLDGKILYKDCLNMYGPFSYLFNAFLYFIFGIKVDVLAWAGVVNTLIILMCVYFITRSISSPKTSFFATLLPLCILVFKFTARNISNYYIPYSYAIVYALSFFLLALLFLIYYLKQKNHWYMYLSALFMGLSISAKLDYALFLIILIPFILTNNETLSKKLNALFLIILPSIFLFGILFLQGLDVNTFKNILKFGYNFLTAPSVIEFNKNIYGNNVSYENFYCILSIFCTAFLNFSKILAISIVLTLILKFIENKNLKWITFTSLFVATLFYIYEIFSLQILTYFSIYRDFQYASFLCLFILFSYILYLFVIKNENFKTITTNQWIFLLIILSTLISMNRCFFGNFLSNLGTYNLILYFAILCIVVFEILPKNFSKIGNEIQNTFAIFAIFVSFTYCSIYYDNIKNIPTEKINSEKVKLLNVRTDYAEVINELLDVIKQDTNKDDFIMTLPEGTILNYITDRKSNNFYYQINEHIIDIYGEKAIISSIDTIKPKYIFFVFTDSFLGITYGKRIQKYIDENYTCIKFEKRDKVFDYDKFNNLSNVVKLKIYKINN